MQEFIKGENVKKEEKDRFPGHIKTVIRDENRFTFLCVNNVTLSVHVLTDKIFRFRYAANGLFQKDFSYAIDPKFKPGSPEIEFAEKSDHFRITTKRVICRVRKENLVVKMLDKSGTIIVEDERGFHWEDNTEYGGEIVKISKQLKAKEFFYGLGDKSNKLNLRNSRYQIWGTDSYGFGKTTDPLYKNIPFYCGIHDGIGYGIFFDNSFRSHFDFGKERANVTSFWADGGEMNYYFIYGPELLSVAEQFTDLTGRPELPPLWALGYHQCKWSYYPESKVYEIANGFRERQIPCDAIYLDIDYMDGFRCFTWDYEKFPNPKKMVENLKKDGFRTVVMIDPGIKADHNYWVCKDGLEKEVFCVRGDGPLLVAPVWPGDCYFPDFTNPKVRDWWADLYKELIAEIGVAGVWNDMNEPAVFMEDNFTQSEKTFNNDVRHDYDGHPGSHRKAHNVYGMQMTRATYHGIKKYAPDHRPFVLTRSSFAGSQRYTSGWTGDNVASWEHLWMANIQCQSMNVSGMSFIGSDIGGFINSPDGELYLRWLQMAIFHPFFRTHSSGDHGDQEPWSFGEKYTEMCKRAIEFRYRILPYIYTTFRQYVVKGTPMLRPLAFLDQHDNDTLHRMEEFGLGDLMLICPISQPRVDGRWMYLPNGVWYNFWTDQPMNSRMEFWAETAIDEIPVYIKAGAVLPMFPLQQYVDEIKNPPITLNVYFINGMQESQLYSDAGEGYEYQNGQYLLRNFKVTGSENMLFIEQKMEGHYKNVQKQFEILLHAVPGLIFSIKSDDLEVDFGKTMQKKKEVTAFKAKHDFNRITITFNRFDEEE